MAGAGNRAGKGGSMAAKAVEHKTLTGNLKESDSLSPMRARLESIKRAQGGGGLTERYKPAVEQLREAVAVGALADRNKRLHEVHLTRQYAHGIRPKREDKRRLTELAIGQQQARRRVDEAKAGLRALRTQRSREQNRSRLQTSLF